MEKQKTVENLVKSPDGLLFRESVDSLNPKTANEAIFRIRQTLRQAQKSGDEHKSAWALLHMAMVLRGQRQYSSVIQVLEQARLVFIELQNQFGLASVFHELSLANRELERNTQSLEYGQQAVKIFQSLGRTLELGWAYDNLSVIYSNMFRRHETLTFAKKARAIFLEFDSQIGLAWNACNLAALYFHMGFYSRAERYYNEALKIFLKFHSKPGAAWSLLGLTTVLRGQCRFEEAGKVLSKSRRLYMTLGMKDRLGWCLLNEAAIKRALGKEAESVQINKRAIHLFSPLKCHDGVGWSLFQLGQIYHDRGQFVKAWQTLREALHLHTDVANKKGIGWVSNEWGKTYLELNDQSHARDCFVKARVLAEQLGEGPLRVEVDKNLAKLNLEEGLLQRASEILDKTLFECRELSTYETGVNVLFQQVRFNVIIGEFSKAESLMQEAFSIENKYDLHRLKPILKVAWGEILMARGKDDEAMEAFTEALHLSDKYMQRRFHALAILGQIQVQMKKARGGPSLSSLIYSLEKDVRSLSSRRLKAKFLMVKGLASYHKNGSLDTRAFHQCIQILRTSGLVVLEKQILGTLINLYGTKEKKKEKMEYEAMLQRLLNEGPVDLHLVRPRHESFADFPVSLIS